MVPDLHTLIVYPKFHALSVLLQELRDEACNDDEYWATAKAADNVSGLQNRNTTTEHIRLRSPGKWLCMVTLTIPSLQRSDRLGVQAYGHAGSFCIPDPACMLFMHAGLRGDSLLGCISFCGWCADEGKRLFNAAKSAKAVPGIADIKQAKS